MFTHEHQVEAGKARYRKLVVTILLENKREDGSFNWERAAERLSCIRLNWGFHKKTGLTSRYMQEKAAEYGLVA